MLVDFTKITGTSCLAPARWQGWALPAPFPPVPAMALLLDPRRRPPAHAVVSRPWLRPYDIRAARAIPPRGRRSRPSPRPQQRLNPRRG